MAVARAPAGKAREGRAVAGVGLPVGEVGAREMARLEELMVAEGEEAATVMLVALVALMAVARVVVAVQVVREVELVMEGEETLVEAMVELVGAWGREGQWADSAVLMKEAV